MERERMSNAPTPLCLVTGANTGIGRVTALEMARKGFATYLACRSEEKARPVVAAIRSETGNDDVHFHPLNLASLKEVRASAESFLALGRPLNVLVNNAGVASNPGQTADGFEWMFGVNHLGHFLFTLLLLDRIKASSPARIVNVASDSHYQATAMPWQHLEKPSRTIVGIKEYEVSKLANVLFSAELSRRLSGTGVTTYALNPGRVATDAWRRMPWPIRPLIKKFMRTEEDGAAPTLRCALAPELANESGLYYRRLQAAPPNPLAEDAALAQELWNRSEAWVGLADA
jgi:NAD(P)-dependent dehydrogenase (short-subunit alcohol dehydrogenase family)